MFAGKKEASSDSEREQKVRLRAEGRIGIGTAKPEEKLGVRGNARIDGDVKTTGRIKDKTGVVMPVGAILAYGGSSAPPGWKLCDGQSFDQYEFPELYEALGNRNVVPDLRSRFIIGAGQGRGNRDADPQLSNYPLNDRSGEETHKLTEAEMPSHGHKVNPEGYHQFAEVNIHYDGDPSWGAEDKTVFVPGDEKSQRHPDFIIPTGGTKENEAVWMGTTQPHNNLPPYYALTYIIKC